MANPVSAGYDLSKCKPWNHGFREHSPRVGKQGVNARLLVGIWLMEASDGYHQDKYYYSAGTDSRASFNIRLPARPPLHGLQCMQYAAEQSGHSQSRLVKIQQIKLI